MRNLITLCAPSTQVGETFHLLLCPFAGGSANAFRSWKRLSTVDMQVSLAVYPGRDHRIDEPCLTDINSLAEQVVQELDVAGLDPTRLVVAGHSMGAQVAYEVCQQLTQRNQPPRGLVLSACQAPHLQGRNRISHLEDRAFLEQLVKLGGCAPELLNEPTWWPAFMPMLRADFQATEQYWYARPPAIPARLTLPTQLVYGSADNEAHCSEVAAWQEWLSTDSSGPVAIAGDHFYIIQHPDAFLACIRNWLAQEVSPSGQ